MPEYQFRCPDGHSAKYIFTIDKFDNVKNLVNCSVCSKRMSVVLSSFSVGSGLSHNATYPNDRRGAARKRASVQKRQK